MTGLLAFDSNNILMRSLKAMEARGVQMSAEDGTYTAPVFVFINTVSKYVKAMAPERVVMAWDRGHARQTALVGESYKANRIGHGEHDDLKGSVFDLAKEFLSLAGIFSVSVDGCEADDVLADYCYSPDYLPGLTITIVSGDKDLLHLTANPSITQIRPRDGYNAVADEIWDAARVAESMGCEATHLPMAMALMGDSTDNIEGIRGVGLKTAVKYLAAVDWDLDALLADPPKKVAAVEGYEHLIRRNMQLFDLRLRGEPEHLLLAPKFEPTDHGSPLWQPLMEWCDQYQMATVKQRLRERTLWS